MNQKGGRTIAKPDRLTNPEYLDRATVQVNVRVPLRLRQRIDEYLQYMDLPIEKRAPETDDWPTSLGGLVQEAIDNFLVTHPRQLRRGPNVKPKPEVTRKEA